LADAAYHQPKTRCAGREHNDADIEHADHGVQPFDVMDCRNSSRSNAVRTT
jgi:hypothetical protein